MDRVAGQPVLYRRGSEGSNRDGRDLLRRRDMGSQAAERAAHPAQRAGRGAASAWAAQLRRQGGADRRGKKTGWREAHA